MLLARLEVLGEVDARGAIRFDVRRPSTVRDDRGPRDVLVENFSRTGFLFMADVEMPAGTLVAVGLGGAGAREAQVVWRDGNRHGCEFLVPLPQSMMARAFRGQSDVVEEIEAAFRERYARTQGLTRRKTDGEEAEAESSDEAGRESPLVRLRRWFSRPSDSE